jgi:hypothetical protein
MIYRKWSLLTGPAAIFGGIVAAVVIADILFVEKVNALSLFFFSINVMFLFVFQIFEFLLDSINWCVTEGLLFLG